MQEDPANALVSYFASMLKEQDDSIAGDDAHKSQAHLSEKNVADVADVSFISPPPITAARVLPEWAHSTFEVLLVRLNHAQIAVPLLQIGMVCKIESDFIRLVNMPSWFMGLYPQKGINIKVLDTDALLNNAQSSSANVTNYRYFLTLTDSQYALACCQIEKVVRLTPEGVRWRTLNDNKLWYRGILPSQMCILVDTYALLEPCIAS